MAKDEPKTTGRSTALVSGSTVIRIGVLVLLIAVAVYRPLPGKMTDTAMDRLAMHIIEPVLRLTYFYPTRMCPDAQCMLWWTRNTLTILAKLVGPMFDYDSELLMQHTEFDGVRVRIYQPRSNVTEADGAIIFIHGGGFVLGNTEMYESLTRRMAKGLNTRLFVSIDYRLAPETVFPGGLEDCERVVDYVVRRGAEEYGVDPNKMVIMGDSAGGNLVAALTQRRKASGAQPPILGQVLLYPLLQFSDLQSNSYRYHKREMEGLAVVDPLSVAYYYLWYAGVDVQTHPEYAYDAVTNGHVDETAAALRDELMDYGVLPEEFLDDANGTCKRPAVKKNEQAMREIGPFLINPSFAPMMQRNLSGTPPTMVATCEFDVLRDEGALYAHRLIKQGVRTNWKHYEHGFHAMLNFHNELVIAQDMLTDVYSWTMQLMKEATI